METFSALLALCAGNSLVIGDFPAQRPVTWSFDVFFDLHPNKRLSKQSWGWWFETPSHSLSRHCNEGCFFSFIEVCCCCWCRFLLFNSALVKTTAKIWYFRIIYLQLMETALQIRYIYIEIDPKILYIASQFECTCNELEPWNTITRKNEAFKVKNVIKCVFFIEIACRLHFLRDAKGAFYHWYLFVCLSKRGFVSNCP